MLVEFNAKKHRDAARRIWVEVGWLKDEEKLLAAMDDFIGKGRAFVAEVNGQAECLVNTVQGTIRHIADDLHLCAVTGVATSRVARKHALASRLATRALAENAVDEKTHNSGPRIGDGYQMMELSRLQATRIRFPPKGICGAFQLQLDRAAPGGCESDPPALWVAVIEKHLGGGGMGEVSTSTTTAWPKMVPSTT